MFSHLKKMRDSGVLCDTILKTDDGGYFKIHKCIMAANSKLFEHLFTSTSYGEYLKIVHIGLPDLSKEVLQSIIDYAYCRQVELNSENIRDIFVAADKYLFFGLIDECCSYMVDHLNENNCISIKKLGKSYGNIKLEQSAHQYLMRNFVDVSNKSKELMELPVEEIADILSREDLNVKEEFVWDTILRWIDVDSEERKKYMHILLKCIRLGLLDSDFFMRNVQSHCYIVENENCNNLLNAASKFFNDFKIPSKKSYTVKNSELARPRTPHEVIFAIGGWSLAFPTDIIETYDNRADRWVKMNIVDPSGPRAYHKCAVIDHNIYVIGGRDRVNKLNSCRCFNTITKEWKEIAPMHSVRCFVSVAVLNNLIYALGGHNGTHRLNTAERYDYKTNQWTMIAPMNMQRSDAGATTLDGYIYIIGGFTGRERLESAERYNTEDNQWTFISPMISRRSGVSCIAHNRRIYALGGFNGFERLKTVEKYNPRYNTWSDIPDMLTARSAFAIGIIDDMIFAIGGYNGETASSLVEYYNESTNQWYEATNMNICRAGSAACIMKNIPNIIDYTHKHQEKSLKKNKKGIFSLKKWKKWIS